MSTPQYELVIEAGRAESRYWSDLWRFRELFYFLAWRDVLVRYKQTAIGIAWALLRPLMTMLAFTIVFGKLAKLPSEGIPYPLLVLSGVLPWFFFSGAVSDAGNSLLENARLISKVYFPRLIVPASATIVVFVDFLIASIVLAAMMAWYGVTPGLRIFALPFFVLLCFAAALGSGLWIAALNVKYRDFRYAIPFILQIGLYISPVGFGSEVVPDHLRFVYSLNPMVGVIDGFRWALLGSDSALYLPGLLLSTGLITALTLSGLYYFHKTERGFADTI